MVRSRLFLAMVVMGVASFARAEDRVVTLRTWRRPAAQRVEIANPTAQPITFTLGFNDQLFENKDAVLRAVRAGDTPQCRAVPAEAKLPCEAYQRVANWLFHFPELTDQFGNTGWAPFRMWVESPMLAVNSFGFGTCGTFADVLAKVWSELGYETRRRELNGHTVTEVLAGGRWCLFDADIGGFFIRDGQILGIDDLFDNPAEAAAENTREIKSKVRNRDFPHTGMYYYPSLISASAEWRGVKPVPRGTDDWRALTVTIPPGGRMVFPQPSRGECLFPAFTDFYPVLDRTLTDPAHNYAVLEVPAGTVARIDNGLYPMQVTGQYCAEVQYPTAVFTTDRYDMIQRFQYDRRFGRAFNSLEAASKVDIYYILSANAAVRRRNEVRLHGDGVGQLKVQLIRADAKLLPPDAVAPCSIVSGDEIAPVRVAQASSSSPGNNPELLVDGKLTTGWISELVDADRQPDLVLDLGELQFVRGLRWTPHSMFGMLAPAAFEVQTSQNGEDWELALCVEDYRPANVAWVTERFPARYARFVRLVLVPQPHFTERGRFQAALGEIEVLR